MVQLAWDKSIYGIRPVPFHDVQPSHPPPVHDKIVQSRLHHKPVLFKHPHASLVPFKCSSANTMHTHPRHRPIPQQRVKRVCHDALTMVTRRQIVCPLSAFYNDKKKKHLPPIVHIMSGSPTSRREFKSICSFIFSSLASRSGSTSNLSSKHREIPMSPKYTSWPSFSISRMALTGHSPTVIRSLTPRAASSSASTFATGFFTMFCHAMECSVGFRSVFFPT